MSTEQVFPVQFNGTPTLTPGKVVTLNDWYNIALRDASMSTVENDTAYYLGQADALEYTLVLLHQQAEVVAKIVEKNSSNFKRAVLITSAVAVGYYVFKNKTEINAWVRVSIAKIKAENTTKKD